MKHYNENPLLIWVNIIIEYCILLSSYFLCGLLRLFVPIYIARRFAYGDVFKFLPVVMLYALSSIILYWILGDYLSIHFKSYGSMALRVLGVQLISFVIGAALLFWIQGNQFSRVLLGMMIVSNTLLIVGKRILLSVLGNRAYQNSMEAYHVLVLGNGDNAKRVYNNLIQSDNIRYEYIGYLAREVSGDIDKYLGTYDDIRTIVESKDVNKIIIAEDELSRKDLTRILSVCNVLGIETVLVPMYADFLYPGQQVGVDAGVNMLAVSALNTNNILGVNISVTNMEKTVQDITDSIEDWRGQYICISNVHTTVMAHEDEEYQKVQNGAVMALPDGGPLSQYSRAHGWTDARRVTGPDLMKEILSISGKYGWKHAFYGSTEQTLEKLRDTIHDKYPGAEVVAMISPPFRDITPEEDSEYVRILNEAKPDFVWVGLGAPKQEIWMAAHKDIVNALMIGVGAAFNYEIGDIKRAPLWMQKNNLEWLYRLIQEPRRLFKRYFITNLKFLWLTRQ